MRCSIVLTGLASNEPLTLHWQSFLLPTEKDISNESKIPRFITGRKMMSMITLLPGQRRKQLILKGRLLTGLASATIFQYGFDSR